MCDLVVVKRAAELEVGHQNLVGRQQAGERFARGLMELEADRLEVLEALVRGGRLDQTLCRVLGQEAEVLLVRFFFLVLTTHTSGSAGTLSVHEVAQEKNEIVARHVPVELEALELELLKRFDQPLTRHAHFGEWQVLEDRVTVVERKGQSREGLMVLEAGLEHFDEIVDDFHDPRVILAIDAQHLQGRPGRAEDLLGFPDQSASYNKGHRAFLYFTSDWTRWRISFE